MVYQALYSEPDKEFSRLGVCSVFGNGQRHLCGRAAEQCTKAQVRRLSQLKQKQDSASLSSLPEPGKFSLRFTFIMESLNQKKFKQR